jgi:hypothetical protein
MLAAALAYSQFGLRVPAQNSPLTDLPNRFYAAAATLHNAKVTPQGYIGESKCWLADTSTALQGDELCTAGNTWQGPRATHVAGSQTSLSTSPNRKLYSSLRNHF